VRRLAKEFDSVTVVDFEFYAPSGAVPSPICAVGHDPFTGRRLRLGDSELRSLGDSPFGGGPRDLVVAFYASAEMACYLAPAWRPPANVIDLYVEFRNLTNGMALPFGSGLLGALAYYGRPTLEAAEKREMQELAMRGGPHTPQELAALMDYCESDVVSTTDLLRSMIGSLDLERALLRGRSMVTAAAIEHRGVPVDLVTLTELRDGWAGIQQALIDRVNEEFCVYEGRTFKARNFAAYLAREQIAWPMLPSGALDLTDETFKDMAKAHPRLHPLRELRVALSQMRLADLAVGPDGRNRTLLSPFRARTSRNQPSNSKFIFGPSTWLRGLIKPQAGHGLAYIDWSQQEFGIAAALSGDCAMRDAYLTGDPYLAFAKQAGAAPESATRQSHGPIRDQFKACVLAVQYGMGEQSLSVRINQSVYRARELLRLHRHTYPDFWAWSDSAVDHAMLHSELRTVFGWVIHVGHDANPRSLRNFPMQANGAEMLRLACVFAVDAGIAVCAPVHDAILIEAPLKELAHAVTKMQEHMARASEIVLAGFRLRSDAKLICYPDRYSDERGVEMWDAVMAELHKSRPRLRAATQVACAATHPTM